MGGKEACLEVAKPKFSFLTFKGFAKEEREKQENTEER